MSSVAEWLGYLVITANTVRLIFTVFCDALFVLPSDHNGSYVYHLIYH
jgi:hypothetical protein